MIPSTNKIRLAKEFVKFNERCFVRLLGDMRTYNFVVDITPDIEDFQYRIRAIDFDQQAMKAEKIFICHSSSKKTLPWWNSATGISTRFHRTIPDRRKNHDGFSRGILRFRLMELLNIMSKDTISTTKILASCAANWLHYFSEIPLSIKCSRWAKW